MMVKPGRHLSMHLALGLVSSFASEATLDERYVVGPPSQVSRTSLNEDPNATADLQESEISTQELALGYRTPTKRSSRYSKRSQQSKRKRRNASGSRSTRCGYGSTETLWQVYDNSAE